MPENETKYISSIKQNNEKYFIKDSEAREDIATLEANQMHVAADSDKEEIAFTFGPEEGE